MSVTSIMSLSDKYVEARRAADEGYGWQDLVVRFHLSEATAKQFVIEAEYRRLAKTQEAKP